ncbi:MAG: hypothetical protein FalmKO_38750 [Falsiruegeria mediterranea]
MTNIVTVPDKNIHHRQLIAIRALGKVVGLVTCAVRRQQRKVLPRHLPLQGGQAFGIAFSHHRKGHPLADMADLTGHPIQKCGTHWARPRRLGSVHQRVDRQRIVLTKQRREGTGRAIKAFECIIGGDESAHWQGPAFRGDSFDLAA